MDNPYVQQKSSGTVLYVIIGVFVIALVIVGVVFVIMQPFKIPFISKKSSSEGFYALTLSVSSRTGGFLHASYELSKDDALYVKGVISENSIEKVSSLSNMSNYTLKAFLSGYYPDKAKCYLYLSDGECRVALDKKGEIFISVARLNDFYHSGAVWVKDGVLRNGTLCVGWRNLVDVSMSLPQTDIPLLLSNQNDKCFSLPANLSGVYHYDVNITHLDSFAPDKQYKITLSDLCVEDCAEEKQINVFY